MAHRARVKKPGGVLAGNAGGEITAEQEKAMGMMALGKSVTEAATETGIGRATLYRWLKHDAAFVAAWNAWRREQRQAGKAKLLGLSGDAIEAVRAAVVKGDGRLALSLLKGMGMLEQDPDGAEDVEAVQREMAVTKLKKENRLKKAEDDALYDKILVMG